MKPRITRITRIRKRRHLPRIFTDTFGKLSTSFHGLGRRRKRDSAKGAGGAKTEEEGRRILESCDPKSKMKASDFCLCSPLVSGLQSEDYPHLIFFIPSGMIWPRWAGGLQKRKNLIRTASPFLLVEFFFPYFA
jgi:hypothetical protein